MKLPELDGMIDRRILINYRVEPGVVKRLLPAGLEPLVVNGYASAGICLLRLKGIGLKNSPAWLRRNSENSAHRFLVRFRDEAGLREGVYIPARHTDSVLNVTLGGNLLSWPHYPATFDVDEQEDRYGVDMRSRDGKVHLRVDARIAGTFPADSMFGSLEAASSYFERCSIGISPSRKANRFKTICLRTQSWAVKPLQIRSLCSTYFEDTRRFPAESIWFDNALLMENIYHEWIG